MSGVADYYGKVEAAESPDGRDNTAGSGAYSKYQFMPGTAQEYAAKTPWGAGLAPDQVKAAVTSDPAKARQLAEMYTANSDGALRGAGLPVTDSNRFALHRFGPAGGVSLLRADAGMPVADWVRSIQWGAGVHPDAVMKQNALDKYVNVGDLRSRFTGAPMHGGGVAPTLQHVAQVEALTPAKQLQQDPRQAAVPELGLADMFAAPSVQIGDGSGWTRRARPRLA